MNTQRSDLEAESLRWLARLGEGESSEHREAFERWRKSPEHAQVYAKAERLWDGLDQLKRHPDLERLVAGAVRETALGAGRFASHRLTFALAASVLVCILAVAGFLIGQYYVPTKSYVTDSDQRSTVVLDDGSQVIMNFGTKLTVKLTGDRRDFKLKRGEALFAVAEDPRRPFRVFAGDGQVTALGTRFQVRNDVRGITVTLLEGRVAVDRRSNEDHAQLKPGDQVQFTGESTQMRRRAVDPDVVSSWTTGRLKFKQTPLTEVLEEVNRYSNTQIRLGEASWGHIPINGLFEIGDSRSVVAALELMLPLEVGSRDAREIVLVRRAGEK